MEFSLSKIEEELQNFFEERLWFPSHKNPYQKLSSDILLSIERYIQKNRVAPNLFRIIFNSTKADVFNEENINIWENFIRDTIIETGRENNLQFSGPVHIQHFFSDKVKEDFEIEVSSSKKSSGKTVNILIEEGNSNEEIFSAYLISPDENIFNLEKRIINIGRWDDNDLVIDNLRISRIHAQIRLINGQHMIFDLDSTAGTRVNGERIRQRVLTQGDVIEIADVTLIYGTELDEAQFKKRMGKTKIFPSE